MGGGYQWGFGLVIDGSADSEKRIKSMISWDVINGLARRSWARNDAAISTVSMATKSDDRLDVTMPNIVDSKLLDSVFKSR